MSTFTEYTGNLFDSDAKALGHGVNTEGRMGAGIAVAFRNADPDMYEAYRQECWSGRLTAGGMFAYPSSGRWVYNIASQDLPGAMPDWTGWTPVCGQRWRTPATTRSNRSPCPASAAGSVG